jgi:serine/threonine protein kinase
MKAIFSSEFMTVGEAVSQQIDVLGPMPLSWWECWEERSQFFNENGRPKEGRYVWSPIDKAFEEGVQVYRRDLSAGEFSSEETAAILDLMRQMLAFRPEERPTAEEILKSEWMVKWALPHSIRAEFADQVNKLHWNTFCWSDRGLCCAASEEDTKQFAPVAQSVSIPGKHRKLSPSL